MKKIRPGQSWASQKRRRKSSKIAQRLLDALKKQFKKTDKTSLIKNAVLILIAVFLIGSILFLGLFAWLSRDLPDPQILLEREVAQSTKIYDRTGEILLYEIFGDENRTLLKVQEGLCNDDPKLVTSETGIPLHALQATIAAEDHSFCTHLGISIKGLARAVIFGGSRGGGSTLTQQLVKNAILTNERTLTRKAKEIILSIALERRYTKDEILQIYFNEIPYGSTFYGIEAAAQNYYGKTSADLTIAEAATLAALPQLPTTYLNNPDRLLIRRDWILGQMAELEFITEEEKKTALAEESPVNISITGITAPHFVLWVKEQLEETYDQRTVEQGGLSVTTTINIDLQKIAEEAIETNRLERSERYGFNNSGLVALDPRTGEILAMVGSVDYFDDDIDGQVNVTRRPLQPGSSFKPIIYAAAFEKGYTPNTILWDAETTFATATGAYAPKNYDLGEKGAVTMRKALQGSLNIPAVKTLYLVGVERGLEFAEKLGYSTFEDRSRFGLAVVLGGAEVKLLDHVAAYSVFAAEGVYHQPVSILKVEDSSGEILEEIKEFKGEKVLDANIARLISNVLSDNGARAYAFGLNSLLQIPGRTVAAKTGTTNNYKDAWTVGYTPSLAVGVWTGNTRGGAMKRLSGGSSVAAPIWNEFMRKALSDMPAEGFTAPSIPQTGIQVLDGVVPSQQVVIDTASGKLATDRTPTRFKEEKVCGEFHSILHYINKNKPTAGLIDKPKDPYYQAWETGILESMARANAKLEEGEVPKEACEIPTEEDDLHIAANEPRVKIKSPGSTNVGRIIPVVIETSAPRGVGRIEYRIDGSFVKLDTNRTGTTLTLPSWVGIGSHTLTVIAYDDIDNAGQDQISIMVTEGGSGSNLTITNPFNNQTIEKVEPEYLIAIENSGGSSTASIVVSSQNLWSGGIAIIGEITNPSSFNTVTWTLPEPSEYLLTAKAILEDGSIIETVPIKVLVKDPAPNIEEASDEESEE